MLCKMAAYTVLINIKKRVDYYKTRRDYRWITNLLTQSGGTQKHLFTGPFLLLYYYTPYMLCIIITIVRYTVRTLLLCIFFFPPWYIIHIFPEFGQPNSSCSRCIVHVSYKANNNNNNSIPTI